VMSTCMTGSHMVVPRHPELGAHFEHRENTVERLHSRVAVWGLKLGDYRLTDAGELC
jgi:hypothetical protein